MEDDFRDSPIQLVSIKDDGDFEITVDGINFLSALKNKRVIHINPAFNTCNYRSIQEW
jgi:hypothetical protein